MPRTVVLLRDQQVVDAQPDFRAVVFAGGDQGEQGPGGLRSSRLTLALQARVVVTAASFAPAAARLLRRLQPIDRPPDQRVLRVKANALQPLQDLPGAVEVID